MTWLKRLMETYNAFLGVQFWGKGGYNLNYVLAKVYLEQRHQFWAKGLSGSQLPR